MKTGKRLKGVVISKPIVYGNIATELLSKKTDHTHKWTVFLRGPNGQDISYFIHKVEFKLHETFVNNTRAFKVPPYEVTETGWGEFEIITKIYFPPSSGEKPISLYHMLKLYPPESQSQTWPKGKPVNNFFYDELVFSEPTEEFFEALTKGADGPEIPLKVSGTQVFSLESEAAECKRLEAAVAQVTGKYNEYKDRSRAAEIEAAKLRRDIAAIEAAQ
ncbi:NuA4 histone H4 acetyltransferase complex and the SWR1 complex subunit [Coemansia sp. RSA 2671]|uniref:Protein AF-9 homolog n=2 Tax=Coemansia TaxID=4863 RepID=A0A9W8GJL4_9FUNG|nr:NuA4 histone H4 acetyltransferase complex and the SWR1 complex subunit [Coemansia sp. RSA 2675]KAJ2011987.1 NuA4 histone H4 acetyltransferase complex and the SWR1 complex subunit [Coemansia sp. S85]KAJ2028141.1 NuA4 histone H4 acetyltransferase complex and the SWR1 complex subunit [Coemansia sp. S610]KAJ2342555.1 NuA4 histone H4 acetyltransferase complex and the SWR1 complex subunit [Coemansia sp. RSA 2671]KAJ2408785.1 NuA4 histone H4 acetyltransferase complex and the SWR1 complex subunit [C